MAQIYTAPRVSRVAKRSKERFDYGSLISDLLSTGIGHYDTRYLADKQAATALEAAKINAKSMTDTIDHQTDQLMKMFNLGEEDRKAARELVRAQIGQMQSEHADMMDALRASQAFTQGENAATRQANLDVMNQGQKNAVELFNLGEADRASQRSITKGQLDALTEQISGMREDRQIGNKAAEAQRALDAVESRKYEAGTGAYLQQAGNVAAAAATQPAAEQAVATLVDKGLNGMNEAGPLSTMAGSLFGVQRGNARKVFAQLKDKTNSANPSEQLAAVQGMQALRGELQTFIDNTSGPITSVAEYFGLQPSSEHVDFRQLQKEIDDILTGPTIGNAMRATESPDVARLRAEVPFAAEKRAAYGGVYGQPAAQPAALPVQRVNTRRLISGPPMQFPPVQAPPQGGESFQYGPPSPTTEEVHTPLDPNAGAMGPMQDIGRALAMRKLAELGLVA